MKQDRTHYRCDRCGTQVYEDLGVLPSTSWMLLHFERQTSVTHRPGGEVVDDKLLCQQCWYALDRWLRNPATPEPVDEPKCDGKHEWLRSCPKHGRCLCASEQAAPYNTACPLHGTDPAPIEREKVADNNGEKVTS